MTECWCPLATGRDLDHAGPFRLERAERGDDKEKRGEGEKGEEETKDRATDLEQSGFAFPSQLGHGLVDPGEN